MLTLVLAIIALLTVRFVTTTIHELGHALPALMFTQSPVKIYVGSYGDPAKSWVWQWGRLTAYMRWDMTQWNMGMCSHAATPSMAQSLLVILGGPLASLLLGLALILSIRLFEVSEDYIFLLTIFILSAILDFIVNILPSKQPSLLHDGSLLYNDGYQLQRLLQIGRLPEDYFLGLEKMEAQDFEAAQDHFKALMEQGIHQRKVYLHLAEAFLQGGEWDSVLETYAALGNHHKLEAPDWSAIGKVYDKKGAYHEAVQAYNRSLYFNFSDTSTLFSRASAYLQLGEYEKAILDFQTAISYRKNYPEAYNYLGLALIRLRRGAEGLEMLRKAQELGDTSPDLYLHLGFYYTDQNENRLALENYSEARRRGSKHHGLAFYIAEAKRGLSFDSDLPEIAD